MRKREKRKFRIKKSGISCQKRDKLKLKIRVIRVIRV